MTDNAPLLGDAVYAAASPAVEIPLWIDKQYVNSARRTPGLSSGERRIDRKHSFAPGKKAAC